VLYEGEWSASFPAALYPGKNPLAPIGQEAGWTPEPFWTRWRREKEPCRCRKSKPDRPTRSSVTVLSFHVPYRLDDRGFECRQGLGIFLFTTASRPAVGSIQPPIQWVPGALSLGLKRQARQADHSPPSSAEVKNECSYNSTSPIRLHGVVLKVIYTALLWDCMIFLYFISCFLLSFQKSIKQPYKFRR
jgi:hypothetical protein